MIDYYLKKHCLLSKDKENPRCKGCIWLNREIKKCVFSLDYPGQVTIQDFIDRIKSIDKEQQNKLSDPKSRFILKGETNDR